MILHRFKIEPPRQIMEHPAFALGAADARAGLPFRKEYERWDTNSWWSYERGRAWGLLAPRHVRLCRRDGKLSADAIRVCHAARWLVFLQR